MVDLLALTLSHALLALAAWRLVLRPDLDRDPDKDPRRDLDLDPPRG